MSRFYFGSDSDSDNDNADSLPFPAPLPREAFSTDIDAPFSPTAFLTTLRHRHQTLEDLRAELRTRSKDLEKELVELVNRDYVDFIGLGSSLNGGDGRVEDLKMGLWGFKRDIEGVVGRIGEVVEEVERELKAREDIRADKTIARTLLALSQRLDELSSLLLLDGSTPADSASLLFDGDGDEGGAGGDGLTSIGRLRKIVSGYRHVVQHLLPHVPAHHPFLKAQLPRIAKVKNTLLLDLRSALKESKLGDVEKTIVVMGFYADLGAESDAVKVLREMKKES
ncbi:oligomeric golgi complex component, COG2-domain-containing protein [Morchella snyderi]|nr:oligomeric golgi complex component, COG2-domain-containing protein [Morchella snyderi]